MNLMSVQQLGRTVLSVPDSVMFGIERKICQIRDKKGDDYPASQSSSIPEHILKRYKKLKNKDAEEMKWNYFTGINTNYDEEEYDGVNNIADDEDGSSRRTDQATSSTTISAAQRIGRTVMSVPDKLLLRYNNNNNTPDDDGTAVVACKDGSAVEIQRKHSILCKDLILDQKGRIAVKELKDQCLQDMDDHLKWYLFDNDTDNLESITSYEQWIKSIHPDNVVVKNKDKENNNDNEKDNNDEKNNQSIEIDRRFYLEASHHLQLWNGYMEKLERTDSIIVARSM